MIQEFSIQGPTPPALQQKFTEEQVSQLLAAHKFSGVELYQDEDTQYKGAFGGPVLIPFVFLASNGTIKTSQGEQNISTDELYLPVVMMEVSGMQDGERTRVNGRDGTVKEVSDLDDYEVSIRGLLLGTDGKYPTEDADKLSRISQYPLMIEVANPLLNDRLSVYYLALPKLKWIPLEGVEDAQAFELTMYSDTEVELIIDNLL